ncbi:MAG TPA: HDOD domain-containing protein [Gallionellaceae bacterium]|nr:HDOD domain-containing protein [Gallionellaceae bacterium]
MSVRLLGRYDTVNELGHNAQSVVYLAKDSRMSRDVAIKKIGPGSLAQNEALLQQARTVSNLHHHNIIPLYDLGTAEGIVYLVYAFIAGESLAQVLKRSGAMPVEAAVRIGVDILDALASAHGQGVMHLDIKPANVIISTGGHNFLTDFGIANAISKTKVAAGGVAKLSPYMAPELISAQGGELRSDIYAVGMMLCEMVTGTPHVQGKDSEVPSSSKVKVDGTLGKIILKATAKNPDDRYSSAVEMGQALLDSLDTGKEIRDGTHEAERASTLMFLLRRIRSKSDFPAMSGVISEINKIVASDSEDSSKLAQVILQDFSLTNKLLKLVNTVSYSQFGGQINTISKAVSIIGFEPIRNIAMSLIVMDFLKNKSQSLELKDAVVSSFFSGIVAVHLAEWKSASEVEEAMICSMFFNLGRMLTKFYFFDESEEIALKMENQEMDEDQASLEVLGVSYNDLGIEIAKSWNFPESLIAGMKKIRGDNAIEPSASVERLNVAVNMANDLCAIASETDATARTEALHKISVRYSGVTDASEGKLASAMAASLQDLSQRSKMIGIDTSSSPLLKNTPVWLALKNSHQSAQSAEDSSTGAPGDEKSTVTAEIEDKHDIEALLLAGLKDVNNTMSGQYQMNNVLQMVLETIYRSLKLRHVLIFSRDVKNNMMVARFGFGEKISTIIPDFRFSLDFDADVFHLSLAKGLDIVIDDVGVPSIANKIPAWYIKAINSRYFLLLPMVVNNTPVGLIYADMLEAKKLQITPKEMALISELRNKAVLAIQQKV